MTYYDNGRKSFEAFDDYIDEFTDPMKVAGTTIMASDALFYCDPIGYDTALSDWFDGEIRESGVEYDNGRFVEINGVIYDENSEEVVDPTTLEALA